MFGKYLYHIFTGPTLSTSTSSFEALDPHDPNLSRLATTMFQKTADYLFGELTATQVCRSVY
jgi:biogenesis of lysosome-related organelles complex 1 subunit 2